LAPKFPRGAPGQFSIPDSRFEQVLEADAAEQFRPDTVGNAVDDLRAVLGRIDMDAERPRTEGLADDIDDGGGYRAGIGVGWFKRCQAL
jgi:hypothetical protein